MFQYATKQPKELLDVCSTRHKQKVYINNKNLKLMHLKQPGFERRVNEHVEAVELKTVVGGWNSVQVAGHCQHHKRGYPLPQQPVLESCLLEVLPQLLQAPLAACQHMNTSADSCDRQGSSSNFQAVSLQYVTYCTKRVQVSRLNELSCTRFSMSKQYLLT